MDRYHQKPEDLRETPDLARLPSIPRNAAITAAVILALSGILVAVVLPELLTSDGKDERTDPAGEGLNIILSSSVEGITIDGTSYDNLPIPSAFHIVMLKGDPVEDIPKLEAAISPMMEYIFGNGSRADLKATPGAGWETGVNPIEMVYGEMEGDSDHEHSVEVPVGLGEQERTLFFELRLWEVED
jgi:hypothetical protein